MWLNRKIKDSRILQNNIEDKINDESDVIEQKDLWSLKKIKDHEIFLIENTFENNKNEVTKIR